MFIECIISIRSVLFTLALLYQIFPCSKLIYFCYIPLGICQRSMVLVLILMSYEETQNEKYVEKIYNAKRKNQQTSFSYHL